MPDTTGLGAVEGLMEEEEEEEAAAEEVEELLVVVVMVEGWERPDQRNTPRPWLAGLGEAEVEGLEEVGLGVGDTVGLGVSMEGASGLSLSRPLSSRATDGGAASSLSSSLVLKQGASQDALKNLREGGRRS